MLVKVTRDCKLMRFSTHRQCPGVPYLVCGGKALACRRACAWAEHNRQSQALADLHGHGQVSPAAPERVPENNYPGSGLSEAGARAAARLSRLPDLGRRRRRLRAVSHPSVEVRPRLLCADGCCIRWRRICAQTVRRLHPSVAGANPFPSGERPLLGSPQ